MLISRKSPITAHINSMDIDCTQEQIDDYYSGTLVQIAFPNLTADEREFIMTGIYNDEWDGLFNG